MSIAYELNRILHTTLRTDLHCHSTCSDGSASPEHLVELALAEGLQVLALTDHDTIAGVERVQEAAKGTGLAIVPAVELSTHWRGGSVHLLGYFPVGWSLESEQGRQMRAWLQQLRQHRESRNRSLMARLRSHGIGLDLDDLAAKVSSRMTVDQLGRPHIAHWLVERGHALSIGDAFAKFLTPGAPTYVQLDGEPTEEAIGQVCRLGGVPVLAHPVRLKVPVAVILPALVDAGLQGMEVYYPKHGVEQQQEYAREAARHGLIPTGGSDFHGRAGERLGSVEVPAEAMRHWRFWSGLREPDAVLRDK